MSASFSTKSMGARCGRSFLICSTSSTVACVITLASLIPVLLALLAQPGKGMNFPRPFSYRFRGRPAIIDPALEKHGGSGARPRAHTGARAHAAMIAQTYLPGQHHAILKHHAAGESCLARNHAMPADAAIVRNHDQVIEL